VKQDAVEGATPTAGDRLAGRAMWVCVAWYLALIGTYVLIALLQPDPPPDPDCTQFGCGISTRDVMLVGGAVLLVPLLLCFVVSTALVTWRARRAAGPGRAQRVGSAFWLGTTSAGGGLLVGVLVGAALVVANARF
jgi:hypothetical protein